MSDKRMWEAKANFVEKVMRENAKIRSLTEEQHSALATLCAIRHDIHGHDGADSFFDAEGARFKEFWGYIDDGDNGSTINRMLSEVNLPVIDLNEFNPLDYESDADYADFGLTYEEAYDKCVDLTIKLNDKIEEYLRKIDAEHGTQYAPTGIARAKHYGLL